MEKQVDAKTKINQLETENNLLRSEIKEKDAEITRLEHIAEELEIMTQRNDDNVRHIKLLENSAENLKRKCKRLEDDAKAAAGANRTR